MNVLLIGESREGKIQDSTYELVAFAQALGAEATMFLAGSAEQLPAWNGTLHLLETPAGREFQPDAHADAIAAIVDQLKPQMVVFSHSSSGWDLAPRVAFRLGAGQISEVMEVAEDGYIVPACNAKLRRTVQATTELTVLTLQAGAFNPQAEPAGTPDVRKVDAVGQGKMEFVGYEAAEATGVDLSRAEIIVSAGRGIGKAENVEMVQALAQALGGELGASRPVVDAGWVDHSRQVGNTGQTVTPKLYVACGISGAIQHLAGMKNSDYVVAINTDKDAPIGEVADVLVVADVKQFVPALTEALRR
ncbi:electron transfer flavoprotein subunit alpha/FixB family protein [Desulfurispirillum indicum]|uniref:Electron transfer flavoprotein alpha subunit n=1 Tax=Desulfurispirillum indicum (strain ATCC BAA-1389 / DSM 22839 / S5) TaxID=653733 RepID=E6W692_DESIS|nr:electron transfer flavoprotein subunit alpha/FixB family protein [Desulfurispirillum indicum]ADU66128.1 Electron transfer flavoprotein alpha subunit [Desulfurispirillum indicum S5]UCZ55533.1 electron transfer flavoprotein subunit alpha/FixB family protein [Desulfurispirillum indicum]